MSAPSKRQALKAQAHPDRPHGSTERMAAVNRAWELAQEVRR